jgi:hypothetical protein
LPASGCGDEATAMNTPWLAVGDYDTQDPDHRVGQEVLVTQPTRRTWQVGTPIAFYTKEPLGRVWEILEVTQLPVHAPEVVAQLPWATSEKARQWAWVTRCRVVLCCLPRIRAPRLVEDLGFLPSRRSALRNGAITLTQDEYERAWAAIEAAA